MMLAEPRPDGSYVITTLKNPERQVYSPHIHYNASGRRISGPVYQHAKPSRRWPWRR